MLTMMILAGGIMILALAFGCALGRAAARADWDREAAFVCYMYEVGLDHRLGQALDDGCTVEAAVPVLEPESIALPV
jgi:hypothetical protein